MERKRKENKRWRRIAALLVAVLLLSTIDTISWAAETGGQETVEMPDSTTSTAEEGETKEPEDISNEPGDTGEPADETTKIPDTGTENIQPGEDGKEMPDPPAGTDQEGESEEPENSSNEQKDTGEAADETESELTDETESEAAKLFAAPRAVTSVKLHEVGVGYPQKDYPFSPIASMKEDADVGDRLTETSDAVLKAMFDASVANGLSEKLYSYSLPKSHRDKKRRYNADPGVSMTYRKVGTYGGEEIDLKVSLIAYENTSSMHTCNGQNIPAGVFFRTNRLDFYTIGIEWAQFKFEFFNQNGKPVEIRGTGTLYDLDYGQKFTADDGIDHAFVTRNNEGHLQYTKTADDLLQDNLIVSSEMGLDNDSPLNIPNGCVTLAYKDKSSFTVSFGVPEKTYTTLSSVASTFGLSGTYSVIDPPLEDPVKSVSTTDITNQETFIYTITQKIPKYNRSENYFENFEIRDNIEDCLEVVPYKDNDYCHVRARTLDGLLYGTVTDKFSCIRTNSEAEIIIQAKNVKSPDFYGYEYEFSFKVRLKQGYNLEAWLEKPVNDATSTTNTYTLPNTAVRHVKYPNENETTKETNTVYVQGVLKKEFFYKGDAYKNVITGEMTARDPVFTVYSDEACTEGNEIGESSYNHVTGLIRLPFLPLATSTGNVTYYMKETAQPTGYVPNATVYEITQKKGNGEITIKGDGYESAKEGESHGIVKNKAPIITKSSQTDKNVKKGQDIWYELWLTNPGNTDIIVNVEDVLPPEVKGKEYKIEVKDINTNTGLKFLEKGTWTGKRDELELPAGIDNKVKISICAEVIKDFSMTDTEDNIIRNRASMFYDGKKFETEEVVHYLTPNPDYTVTKERITQPPNGQEGFFAGTGQEIQFKATLTNTGDIPLKIDIRDAFHTEKYFEFVGSASQDNIDLPVGASTTVTFKAKILSDAKPSIETTNKRGYKNTVTSTGTGSYTDPETQATVPVSIEKEASAYTPVIALPEYTLPDAGGMGTYWFTTGGVILMAAAVLLLKKNRGKTPR